jgi:hypothetical protein
MSAPRIFYFCYDSQQPTGGERHSYQHVDILRRHGYEAFVLHKQPGFRLRWFENNTPVVYWRDLDIRGATDYFVYPETLGLTIRGMPGKKIIFNKNVYYGFNVMGLSERGPCVYADDDVVCVISVSHHNAEYLRFTYPSKRIVVVTPDIAPERLSFRPLASKRLQIAYAAKASMDGRTLFQILRARAEQRLNRLVDARWVAITAMTERQVADVLGDSVVLLFLSVHEGLGRLPLEAMACGCVVCAFDCGPPSEYLPAPYRFACGDHLSVVREVERIAAGFPDGLGALDAVAREGRRVAERFCRAAQEDSLLNAWRTVIEGTQ